MQYTEMHDIAMSRWDKISSSEVVTRLSLWVVGAVGSHCVGNFRSRLVGNRTGLTLNHLA